MPDTVSDGSEIPRVRVSTGFTEGPPVSSSVELEWVEGMGWIPTRDDGVTDADS